MRNVTAAISLGLLAAVVPLATLSAAAEPAKPRSAESIACSKEADAKGLHGKPRKAFRKTCIKNAKGKPGTT